MRSRLAVALVVVLVLVPACREVRTPVDSSVPPPSLQGLQWRQGPSMPTPRTEVAAATLGGQVYVAGGFTGDGRASAAVEVYDPEADAWSAGPALPEPVHHAALVSTGDALWLMGGYDADGAPIDRVRRLSAPEGPWVDGPSLPIAVGALSAAVVDGRIHVAGGATGFGRGASLSDQHHTLDPAAGEWVARAPLPEPRDHLAAASAAGLWFVVVGGRRLSLSTNMARTDVYDNRSDTWLRGPDLRTPRGGIAAAEWDKTVFAVGGEQPTDTIAPVEALPTYLWLSDMGSPPPPGSLHERDPALGWLNVPFLPTPRHGLGAVATERALVVVGGGTSPGLSVSGATELLEHTS